MTVVGDPAEGLEFADEFDRNVYAEWHQPLLERLFGHEIDLRHDLYELTHSHRRDHNGRVDDGACTAWPNPPYYAPVWRLIVDRLRARRFLEGGTGIGYTAALMADAGGPGCQVDTIEVDPDHADRAQRELTKIGLSHRVRVLRGDAGEILSTLTMPYDVVFADGGNGTMTSEFDRLTAPGGAPADIKGVYANLSSGSWSSFEIPSHTGREHPQSPFLKHGTPTAAQYGQS